MLRVVRRVALSFGMFGGLYAAPSCATATWPAQLPATDDGSVTTTPSDVDHDGVMDTVLRAEDGGSGWHHAVTCVRDGRSGHAACVETISTPTSLFWGWRTAADSGDATAAALLTKVAGPDIRTDCPLPSPERADQGAMFAIQADIPEEGTYRPTPRWRPGPPMPQTTVCMRPEEAATFPGALTWKEGEPRDGWTVVYTPRAPSGAFAADGGGTLSEVARTADRVIFQQGPAIALYDPTADRHTWLASWADGKGGFKLNRWQRLGAITLRDAQSLAVTVRTLDGEQTVIVQLP